TFPDAVTCTTIARVLERPTHKREVQICKHVTTLHNAAVCARSLTTQSCPLSEYDVIAAPDVSTSRSAACHRPPPCGCRLTREAAVPPAESGPRAATSPAGTSCGT